MMDEPSGAELLGAVARYLRETLLPKLPPDAVFHARVAANAVDLVRRQLEVGGRLEAEELARLRGLLGADGALGDLNRELAAKIAAGEIGEATPGLMEHLWQTTLAKLAVDQPSYASYRREVELRGGTEKA